MNQGAALTMQRLSFCEDHRWNYMTKSEPTLNGTNRPAAARLCIVAEKFAIDYRSVSQQRLRVRLRQEE